MEFISGDFTTRDPAKGFSLGEALLLFGDLNNPREHNAGWYVTNWWRSFSDLRLRPDQEEMRRRWDRDHREAQWKIIAGLLSGELIAIGFAADTRLNAQPSRIDRQRWQALIPDFANSSACGGGTEVSGILVSPAGNLKASAMAPQQAKPGPKSAGGAAMRAALQVMVAEGWRAGSLAPLKEAYDAVIDQLRPEKGARGYGVDSFRRHCADLLPK